MIRLRGGLSATPSFATVAMAVAVLAGASAVLAPSAAAETVGGEQLSSTHRSVNLQDGAAPLPQVWAETWVLADADTGEVLAHKGAHVQRAPASTLKMLTALTVLPQTTPDQTYVATAKAANTYGSKVGLRIGRTYTMDELWNAVFLPSANDAAIAVAEANGGVGRTVRQMNEVAAALGAHDTTAKNTSGLDSPGQVSSAYDLALIARAGLQREDFAGYVRKVRASFPNTRGRGDHTIYTTNRMLLHGWRGAMGVKTGFTSQAGRTFVGAAERKGRTLIVALMGIKESTEGAATELLSWGFKNADKVEPVGVLVESTVASDAPMLDDATDAPLSAGTEPSATAAEAAGDLEPEESASASLLPAGMIGVVIAGLLALGIILVRRGTASRGRHTA